MQSWDMHHEADTITKMSPTDARGLRLRRECGYQWVDRRDGQGWRQIQFVIRDLEYNELAASL